MNYSIVIPTLYKSPDTLFALLNNLVAQNNIEEIIIINNSDISINFTNNKVKILQMPENIYVYAAWNMGVEMAKSEYVAILNDDIKIPLNCFDLLKNINIDNYGIIGIDFLHINNNFSETIYELYFREVVFRDWGFGVFMIFNKKNYAPIPDELKVWCGDDYIFYECSKNNKPNFVMTIPVITKMSSTSDLPEFTNIKYKDEDIFWSKYKNKSTLNKNWIGEYFKIY